MKKVRSYLIILFVISIATTFTLDAQVSVKSDADGKEQYVIKGRERTAGQDRTLETNSSSYAISGNDGYVFFNQTGSTSSQLSLSKIFEDESKKNTGSFEVDESIKNITLMLNGSVKAGKIIISISLPDGSTLKEITIDESADIQFNQNLRIAKDEKKYYGKWTYSVESVKATGKYRLSLNTN